MMIRFRYILALLWLNILCLSVAAQTNYTVTGKIIDRTTGYELIGATVLEENTSNGTITDVDGNFKITVSPNATLSFSYIGYKPETRKINQSYSNLIIQLTDDANDLDEVIVVGYSVQKKSDITGAISSVSGKDINNIPVSSALQALQGKAAGVQILQNTGAPGASTTIKIRGTGTVNDSDPLFVVDGFIVDAIDHISPNDIASIEILKDAASCSVYGSRSANGVVLVTTKSGESGKTKISFDTFFGVSNPWKTIPVLNTSEYALMLDYINGESNYSADGQLYYSKDAATGELYYDASKFNRVDTIARNSPDNWWDAITRTGFKQQYNIAVSGGSETSRYIISANYFKEKGIVKASDYERLSIRMNLNNNITKWLTLSSNMSYVFDDRNVVPEGQNSVLKSALYQSPMIYTYNTKGYYSENHPLAVIERNHNNRSNHRIDMNFNLNAQINKYLSYQFKVSDYVTFYNSNQFSEVNKLEEDFTMPYDLSTISKYNSLGNKWEVNNLLNFAWNNQSQEINAVAGYIIEGYRFSDQESTKSGTVSNDDNLHYLTSGYMGDKAWGIAKQWNSMGVVGRVNYNVLQRYLFQVNFRADGSSIFSKENRWGYFPSASVGWKFSGEKLFEEWDWFSLGKVRFGWGELGNNRIDELARYTIINTYNKYSYPYGVYNHIVYPGATATSIGNSDIKWEKTRTYNLGLDLSFFNNALTASVELFDKLTSNMLLQVPVSVSAGLVTAPMTNAGSVSNKGIEFNLNYKGRIRHFSYEAGFNMAFIKNEVKSLGTGNEPIYGGYLSESSILGYVTKTEVGRPIGSFYGYVTDGIFNSYEEVKASAQYDYGKNDFEQTTRPGDFRFKDLNGDGQITAEDRTFLGSPLPKYTFGIPISLRYKGINLTMFFQGQGGNKIFNVMDYYLYNAASGNVHANIRSLQWSGQYREDREYLPMNLTGKVPDLDPSDTPQNFRASDFFVHDGSYIRLQDIRLSYDLPAFVCQKMNFNSFMIFIGATNLFTITKYNGFDPEIGKVSGTESNNLNLGVDHGNYPQTRTFTMGLKFEF